MYVWICDIRCFGYHIDDVWEALFELNASAMVYFLTTQKNLHPILNPLHSPFPPTSPFPPSLSSPSPPYPSLSCSSFPSYFLLFPSLLLSPPPPPFTVFLPASVMLPPKRLHKLLMQALQLQVDRCPFHYVEQDISQLSLLTDHICSRLLSTVVTCLAYTL